MGKGGWLGLEHDIGRLEVTMQNPMPVGVVKGQADLLDELYRFRQTDPLAPGPPILEPLA